MSNCMVTNCIVLDKILERHKQPKVSEVELDNINRSISGSFREVREGSLRKNWGVCDFRNLTYDQVKHSLLIHRY